MLQMTLEKQMNKIKENLSSLENCSIRIVSSDRVVKGIRKFSSSHDLDLLAMIPREHNLFDRLFAQSITKTVAIDLDIPLLTFRP